MSTKRIGKNTPLKTLQLRKARLDELIEEALVDASGESEQATGFTQCWRMTFGCPSKRKSLV